MKVFIPELRTVVKLTSDWTFPLYNEDRNEALAVSLGLMPTTEQYHEIDCKIYDEIGECPQLGDYWKDSEEERKRKNSLVKEWTEKYQKLLKKAHEPWPFMSWHTAYNCDQRKEQSEKVLNVTLPAGTRFVIDRIYIRKGNKEYSSVTLVVGYKDRKAKVKGRFWVKLADFNAAGFEVCEEK